MKFAAGSVGALLLAGLAQAADPITPEKVVNDIKVDKLQNVLWNLQKIARDNGGNRAYGFPGFNASMDFVLERARTRFGKHMDTYVQEFNHVFQQTRSIDLKGPDGKDVDVYTLQYNTGTPLPDGTTASLIDTPVDDARGSMCFEDQWEGIDATGKIALVRRGTCAIADKVKLAKKHGAVAVILYHNLDGVPGSATLSASNIGQLVPVGVIKQEVGQGWSKRIAAGEDLKVTFILDAITEQRPSWNIISETKQGDPNNVVMLGAHLDSVPAGPGVNDDGSGSAALLELMGSVKKYTGIKNKIRFAWWGAEEVGLIGSLHYTSTLSDEEADKIKFYFNYDMIASMYPRYAVYTDDEADTYGAKHLYEYVKAAGKPAEYSKFGTSSDYLGFLNIGIPSSGLFTGAGGGYDLCYHLLCDDLTNINWDAYEVNAKAAANVLAKFALNMDGVPPRKKTSVNPQSRRGVQRNLDLWANTANVVEKHTSCGGEKNTV